MDEASIKITFRKMDHSPVFDEYARKQIARLDKFLTHERLPIDIALVIEARPVHSHHNVELRVKAAGFNLVTHDEGTDMYKVIDSVITTMTKELSKHKERMLEARKDGHKREI